MARDSSYYVASVNRRIGQLGDFILSIVSLRLPELVLLKFSLVFSFLFDI